MNGNWGWRNWFGIFLLNFATPVVFFWTFQFYGAKPAIGFALFVTAIQVLAHLVLRIRFSPFLVIASGFTVLFGGIDLLITSPRFFKLEPFMQNLVMGAIFLGSAFQRTPIIGWLARELPEFVRPDLTEKGMTYLRKLTVIWALYFLVKAAFFLYLAYTVDLGSLVLLRSLIGGGSMFLLLVGELLFRRWRDNRT